MWLYKNLQAFSSQSWQISFSNVFFCPESIFAVCQDGSLTVFLTASKKRWPPFLPDRVTQSGNALLAMSQKGVSSPGKFSTL